MIVSILLVFMNFMIFFLFSGYAFLLYTFYVLWCAIWFFNEIRLLVKKKRKALQRNKLLVTDILGPCFLGLGRLNEYDT